VKIPSTSGFPIDCKDLARHKITGSFGFKEFDGTPEESAFWNKASEDEKASLKKKHVDTGRCLLCLIDEVIPEKLPEPVIAVEPEPEVHVQTFSRKIAGGILNRTHERTEVSSPNLKASWAWHNEEHGIVAWTFQNTGTQQASGILFRNSYYFGNAYWPIYQNNPGFGVAFATKLEPLVYKTIENNTLPLGIVAWKEGEGSYKNIIAFVFTLAPGQTWQVLEGGFSRMNPPQEVGVYEVSSISETDFSITYDQSHIDLWNEHSGTSDSGYAPNPNRFGAVQVLAPPEAPFVQLFEDSVQQGTVSAPPPTGEEAAPLEEAASSAPQYESKFWSLMARNSGSLEKR
jgi:hypothetical protein